MTYEQAAKFRWNPFDVTKIWPHKEVRGKTHAHRDTHREIHTERQTDRCTQRDRQTDRQTDRHRKADTHR